MKKPRGIILFLQVSVFVHLVSCQSNASQTLNYFRIDSFNTANRLNISNAGDFLKIIADHNIKNVFYTDSFFVVELNSIIYALSSKGYASLEDLAAGDAGGFKEGKSYYYAREKGLNTQEEVEYYQRELFFSPEDYRDAENLGFVKNSVTPKLTAIRGLMGREALQKSLRYANAVMYLLQTQSPDSDLIDNTGLERLIADSKGAIRGFGNYYYVNVDLDNDRYGRGLASRDAAFYYACKFAQYSNLADYVSSRRSDSAGYTIKNTSAIIRELGFQNNDDFSRALSENFTNSTDYYLAKKYGIGFEALNGNRALINEIEMTKQRYATDKTHYALMIIQLLKRRKGVPVSVDVFMEEYAREYSGNIVARNSGFTFTFDAMYNEVPRMRGLIVYDTQGKSFYLR
jgi:hypothetical protein